MNKIVIAPIEVITSQSLTEPERRVLLILYSFSGKSGEEVYPGIEVISEMAGYNDKTRVSKITSSLEKKGWLTKKRRGYTGGVSYLLSVPEAKLAEETKLAPQAAKLAPEANTKLAPEAKNKEQPNELPKEQTNKKNIQKKSDGILDYSKWPEMPADQTMIDWLAMRKRIKADVSQTVINTFAKELHKAKTFGISVDECLAECVTRKWQGFKFEWLKIGDSNAANQQPSRVSQSHGKPCAADQIRSQARTLFERIDNQANGSGVYPLR